MAGGEQFSHITRAAKKVEYAVRQSGFSQQLGQAMSRQRRQAAGFEHHRVAGRQGRRDFPYRLQQRVVPRRDQGTHAHRLALVETDDMGWCMAVDAGAFDFQQCGVIAKRGDHVADVAKAFSQRLASVEGFQACKMFGILLDQVGNPLHELCALRHCH
ncbi:hypothetical protein D3C71_1432130 [compost metagenome]